MNTFNQSLFLAINASSSMPRWQIDAAIAIADYLIYLVPLMLAALWLSGGKRQRETAVRACCVAMLALGFNQLIGLVYMHPRPFMIGLGHTFVAHAPDSSFPSDHATVFASVALTLLCARMWRRGALMLLTGLAVAWARVFVGVHFPLDMAGAVIIACAAFVIVMPLWSRAGESLTRALIAVYRKVLAWPIAQGWIAQ